MSTPLRARAERLRVRDGRALVLPGTVRARCRESNDGELFLEVANGAHQSGSKRERMSKFDLPHKHVADGHFQLRPALSLAARTPYSTVDGLM